jgi:hypothetical protein
MPFNDDERNPEEYAGPLYGDFDDYFDDSDGSEDPDVGRWDDDPSPYDGTYSDF